ncbi:MAG: hypothetical protein KF819_32145 [Labilithrix sp.]|nr:hypothetical protein [Labilithrix sp.]
MSGRGARSLIAAAIAGVALASPADALGQAADKATAEVLFEQAKALLAEGNYAEACPKLAESLRLDTGIGTMLYLADCYERTGKTASAWGQFREAQASAAKERDAREKIAKERADRLEPSLSRLTVVVPPASDVSGLVVTRDGTPLGRAGWGIDAPVDPGPHVVRVSAPGHEARESTIEVGPSGARASFVVTPLALARAPSTEAPAPAPLPTTQRTIGITLAAVGVAAVGVGTFFGVRAIGTLDDSKAHCGERTCDQTGLDLRDTSRTEANVATALFVAGGVLAGTGAVLWLTAPRSPSRGIAVAPAGAGLVAAGRF